MSPRPGFAEWVSDGHGSTLSGGDEKRAFVADSPMWGRQLLTPGAAREGRLGYGLMRCGSFGIARSRQNGLGSIPLFCVTRSVDRLTDGGHREDLYPGRGAPVCLSLKGWRSYGTRVARWGEGRWSRKCDLVYGARVRNFRVVLRGFGGATRTRGIGRRHGRFSPHPRPRSAVGSCRAPQGTTGGGPTSRRTVGLWARHAVPLRIDERSLRPPKKGLA